MLVSDLIDRPIGLTPEAREQILDTLRANKIPDSYGLRVGIKGGGCGASWLLGFDQPGTTDQLYEVDGVRVIIDKKHLLYVLGVEVGYGEGEAGAGFTVQKPEPSKPEVI
ncbi:HesB/IscA family protein [Tellurirhabdus bombi]|uniref:HesB/IscA family protein n=1 Tax=Tellurirhabdus bombi TaxID=2907205 RepID=UPI001F2B7988|nr:iron-sulfur cluster assembly accessory protein [Tellurirhabdus bombi]